MSPWQIVSGILTGGISTIADGIMNANGINSFEQAGNNIQQGLSDLAGQDFNGGPLNALFGETGLLSNPQGAWDNFTNGQTNTVNAQIARENLEYQRERNEIEDARYEEETNYNRAFAEENRDYQRKFAEEEREYQRALQERIFEREDTALERQAASLSSMGINPLSQQLNGLGAGQAVSASVPGSSSEPGLSGRGGQALHNDFKAQGTGVLSLIAPLMSVINGVDNINTAGIQRDSLRAQVDGQRLANQAQDIENRYKELLLQQEIKSKEAGTESTKSATRRAEEKHPYELSNEKSNASRNKRVDDFQERTGLNDIVGQRAAYNPSVADIAWTSERMATSAEKAKEEGKQVNPLSITGNKLKDSLSIVGNSLSNVFGNGAKKIINFFSKNNNKNYKMARQGRMY